MVQDSLSFFRSHIISGPFGQSHRQARSIILTYGHLSFAISSIHPFYFNVWHFDSQLYSLRLNFRWNISAGNILWWVVIIISFWLCITIFSGCLTDNSKHNGKGCHTELVSITLCLLLPFLFPWAPHEPLWFTVDVIYFLIRLHICHSRTPRKKIIFRFKRSDSRATGEISRHIRLAFQPFLSIQTTLHSLNHFGISKWRNCSIDSRFHTPLVLNT